MIVAPYFHDLRKHHNQGSVVKLIDHGAEVNVQDMQGVTALMFSCQYGNRDMLVALLDAGADIDMQDKDGSSALIHAATVGHDEAVSVLLDYRRNHDFQGYDTMEPSTLHLCKLLQNLL